MSERNRKVLNELLQKPGNHICADCKTDENLDWASCNLGIFLCQDCASIHRSLGVDHSRVKSVRLDNWDDEQVKRMAEQGNIETNKMYEQYLPKYYRRPSKNDVQILRVQFIRAKYERKEFMYPDKQLPYSCNKKEGLLMKRGKKKQKFIQRRFLINSKENCIQYFNKDPPRGPKDTILLDDVNVVFVPDKIGNYSGFQITFLKNGVTRNLFLYSENPKDAVDWYTSIRSAKLERRRLAFPDRTEEELCKDLTSDFLCEGYLHKMGPNNEPYRKRWFSLDRRKLMYMEGPLDSTPKGEVFIGHKNDGYSVENCTNNRGNGLEFILKTPGRPFILKTENTEDKERWITILNNVTSTQPTPQDIKIYHALANKKR